MRLSTEKLIIAGKFAHHYRYATPVAYDFATKTTPKPRAQSSRSDPETTLRSARRAKKNLKLLAQTNISERNNGLFDWFVTFTFAENITQLEEANLEFGKFIKRANYQIYKSKKAQIKYVAVPEYQSRGAVHFHVLFFGLPYVANFYDTFSGVWQQGFIWAERFSNPNGVADYLCKYLAKSFSDPSLDGSKRFYASRNLLRPKVYRDQVTIIELLSGLQKTLFERTYQSMVGQKVIYRNLQLL